MPRQKTVTQKESKAIDLILQGRSQNEAIFEAYNCGSKQSARGLANRVFKRQIVRNELQKRQEALRISLSGKVKKFIEVLNNKITQDEVAQRLADLIKSKDGRTALKGIENFLRLYDEYPAGKSKIIGLFDKLSDLEGNKEEIEPKETEHTEQNGLQNNYEERMRELRLKGNLGGYKETDKE
jgi:hypothetical protein